MKKSLVYFCTILLLTSNIFANNSLNYSSTNSTPTYNQCVTLFKEYDIDPEVRSPKGWQRIYNSGGLLEYLHIYYLNKSTTKQLYRCLITNGFKIELYQRSIGDKKYKDIKIYKDNNHVFN
jgi:hypothetical protein